MTTTLVSPASRGLAEREAFLLDDHLVVRFHSEFLLNILFLFWGGDAAPGISALPLWKSSHASSSSFWFSQTASATLRWGACGGQILGAPGGKPFYKITCPDLMEVTHRWKSGLLSGGEAQPLKSMRQTSAQSSCVCRKYMQGKELKVVFLILLWPRSWWKTLQEFRDLFHSEIHQHLK